MDFTATLEKCRVMLTEGAVAERLRRRKDIELHPTLFNTPLVNNDYGRQCMREIYRQYREIARRAQVPSLLCAPTWRVNIERLEAAGQSTELNRDAVFFMQQLKDEWQDETSPLFVGGLIGPRNDCYKPDEALSIEEAEQFHSWQLHKLAAAGVDVVICQTFPAVSEAIGVIRACASIGVPCIMSCVINRRGLVLDQTDLAEAVRIMDEASGNSPLGYMVNCVHPTFVLPEKQPPELFRRLIGIQANASSLDHEDLDGSAVLMQSDMQEWGELMLELNTTYGMKILGGCCGTDEKYLGYISSRIKS
ncbi:homocysteine S-methyltransferase family protein [Desulfosediminicola ganghwensis]|uniref:homocysteine S-methyltransferase family protein n=1 Tax=Desulfosediminicola ganghwensis TaxID=2569540 RepID=UPI0010AC1530|nr:homocysteine S-methyltransferase family protein [Desulfosediminicola ganghwensis]